MLNEFVIHKNSILKKGFVPPPANLVFDLLSSFSKDINQKKIDKKKEAKSICWYDVIICVHFSSSYFATCYEKDNLIHFF